MSDSATATMDPEPLTTQQAGTTQPADPAPVDPTETVNSYAGRLNIPDVKTAAAFVNDALIALGVELGSKGSAAKHKLIREHSAFLRAVEKAPELMRTMLYMVDTMKEQNSFASFDELDVNALAVAAAHSCNAALVTLRRAKRSE